MPRRIHPDIPEEDHAKRITHEGDSIKFRLFSVQPIHPTLELDIEDEHEHNEEEE